MPWQIDLSNSNACRDDVTLVSSLTTCSSHRQSAQAGEANKRMRVSSLQLVNSRGVAVGHTACVAVPLDRIPTESKRCIQHTMSVYKVIC